MIGDRSVWMAVLRDIMEVMPLRRVLHALPNMSASELKQKAVHMTRLDSRWNREIVHPVKIDSHPLGSGVCKVHVWPGGDFILTLHSDGTLQLYRNQDLAVPLVTVPRPDCASRKYFPNRTNMRRTYNTHGEYWVVVVDYYKTPE
jgi:hypothetical protein